MEDTIRWPGDSPMDDNSNDADMTNSLMDALQILGVEPLMATRVAYALVKKQRSKPTLMELYGRGSIVLGANVHHRNLNVHGLDAPDLRTMMPSGRPLDFTKPSDRRLALWLVKTRRPM